MPSVISEHQQWFDSVTGELIVNGSVYIGVAGLDPQVLVNQITIYSDRALTTPIANPQTTDANGQTTNKIWISELYSIAVTNSADVVKYSELDNGQEADIASDVAFTQTGAGAVLSTVDAKLNESISVKDFGAVGDGTDSTSAVQAAIDTLTSGGRLYFPTGTYLITSKLTITVDNISFCGDGESTVLEVGGNVDLISIFGSIETGDSNTMNANTANGSTTIVLSSGKGANFSADDWALVLDESADPNHASSLQKKGEIVRVDSISTDTLTLHSPLQYSYTTADTAQVQIITMVSGVSIKNMTINNPDPTNFAQYMIEGLFCNDLSIENVKFTGNRAAAIALQGCVDASISGCRAIDLKSQIGTPTGFGYMVLEAGPNLGLNMTNCSSRRVRHTYTTVESKAVAGTTLDYGVPTGSVISGCTSLYPLAAGFDTHAEGISISFVGCKVIGSRREGFQMRGTDISLTDCSVDTATAEGFQFFKTNRLSATNCIARNTNLGIDPETATDARQTGSFLDEGVDTYLFGCRSILCGGLGFELETFATSGVTQYTNCHVRDSGQQSAGSGFAIVNTSAITVILNGCTSVDSGTGIVDGFRAVSATPDLFAIGCYSKGHTTDPFVGAWSRSSCFNSGMVGYGQPVTTTIATDTIVLDGIDSSNIILNGEGASADDLSTITGGTGGDRIVLSKGDATPTIKHGVGNIFVEGGADYPLAGSFDLAYCFKSGSNWIVSKTDV